MISAAGPSSAMEDAELAARRGLATANSVFGLALIVMQARSPGQAMRLVTTAVPAIVPGQIGIVWHPSRSGDYFERAPEGVGEALAMLAEPTKLVVEGFAHAWAFPVTSPLRGEAVALVVAGAQPLSEEESFLLSVLAQLCGTVIAKLELVGSELAHARRVEALNGELESTVLMLRRTMEIHHKLTEIVPSGEEGIARTLHELTGAPIIISDGTGYVRARAGGVRGHGQPPGWPGGRPDLIGRLRAQHGPVYHDESWMVLASPRPEVVGVIALVDPTRTAGDLDRAALEHAATVLNVELARQYSVAQAELRVDAARERDVAQERAAVLAASEARQRAILEAALDAVVSMDSRGQVTYVNSAFEEIFKYRAEEVLGRELAEVIVPPFLRAAHRAGLARYLAGGPARVLDRRVEITAMRSDGSQFPAEVTVTEVAGTAAALAGSRTFTGYIRDITERRRAQQDLMESRARLVSASDAARRRVTRDLHDGAQQRLVTTLINLQLAEQRWDSAPERARELLEQAISDAKRGIEDLREIVAGIHPAALTEHGLSAALDALASRLPVPVRIEVPSARLPPSVEVSVYFFCSEALTNVVKHARAGSAWVKVDLRAGDWVVEVGDDGVGGAEARSEAGGLTGLRDRVGAVGGKMEISSPARGGTVLRATIPSSGKAAPRGAVTRE